MGKKSKISTQSHQVKKSRGTSPSKINIVLAIESSCDDTSVALVRNDGHVLGLLSQNQDDIHAPFGGVLPELACRNHTMRIHPLIESLFVKTGVQWGDVDGVAVTSRPGLLGSLLVGVTVAKSLALIHDKPLLGVNHLEGHLYAPFLKDKEFDLKKDHKKPFVGLCVSGGHTSLIHAKQFGKYKILGRTLDDAAGEAFDKFGKILGLGYPAGRLVDEAAAKGNVKAFEFPRPLLHSKDLNFSFSGLKTAGRQKVEKEGIGNIHDLCASYQEAIVDVLVEKLANAVKVAQVERAAITGGVACNSRLRAQAKERAQREGFELLIAPGKYCTDNAAMIGFVGIHRLNRGERDNFKLSPQATPKISSVENAEELV